MSRQKSTVQKQRRTVVKAHGAYTEGKVHLPLASALDAAGTATVTVAHWDRYSTEDEGGLASQVARHTAIYSDADTAAYRQLPEAAFVPGSKEASKAGVVFISESDITPKLPGRKPVASMVVVGTTLFTRMSMSATKQSAERLDGAAENPMTLLVWQTVQHLGSHLNLSRWKDDPNRAAREPMAWVTLMAVHQQRGVKMGFGGRTYDLSVSEERFMLGVLGALGTEDDPARRRKVTGGRLSKIAAGGAVMSEDQMPTGWRLSCDDRGRPVKEGTRGLVPVVDEAAVAPLAAVYAMYAEGKTHGECAAVLAEYEQASAGAFRRRSGQRRDTCELTFASTLGDRTKSYDAVLSLMTKRTPTRGLPKAEAPSDEAINKYLAGADPSAVFDLAQRLFIAKVELVRTGTYLRVLVSDIKGRDTVLDGRKPQFLDEYDDTGYFVIEAPWPKITDEQGQVPAGLSDEVCRKVAARLLRGIRGEPAKTGGRAHRFRGERRAIENFLPWIEGENEYMLIARQHNSGKANAIVLARPEAAGINPPGSKRERRGWTLELSSPTNIVGTVSIHELCLDVAHRIEDELLTAINANEVASLGTVAEVQRTSDLDERRQRLLTRAQMADDEAKAEASSASGARKMASKSMEEGDEDAAMDFYADAQQAKAAAVAASERAKQLRAEAEALSDTTEDGDSESEASHISVVAYLVAGLRRAAANGGWAPARVGEIADNLLGNWRFTHRTDQAGPAVFDYTVNLTLPLLDGGTMSRPVTGRVRDVRNVKGPLGTGPSTGGAATAARIVFGDGRSIEDAVTALDTSRMSLVVHYLMPWLRDRGVTSRGLKCALVDHPITAPKQVIHAHLTGAKLPTNYGAAWARHIVAIYTDQDAQWGDAAVPDDTSLVRTLVATLSTAGPSAINIKEAARVLGVHVKGTLRPLVVPPPNGRPAGFTRPRYLAYAEDKQALQLIACPHDDCDGVCDVVVLLPEVAASGYGVLCSTCRRAPNIDEKWPTVVFPPSYTASEFENVGGRGSLRKGSRTRAVAPVEPLSVGVKAA